MIGSGSEDVAAWVRALTGARDVDVVLNPVGGPAFETALRCLASEGRLVVIGFASGQVGTLPAGVALGKNVDLIGCAGAPIETPTPTASAAPTTSSAAGSSPASSPLTSRPACLSPKRPARWRS